MSVSREDGFLSEWKGKVMIIIIITKRISRAPIYRTMWEHRALYK